MVRLGIVRLLKRGHDMPLPTLRAVAEVHAHERLVYAVELVLHALAQLHRELQYPRLLLGRGVLPREDDLHEAGIGLEYSVAVARGEVVGELEALAVQAGVVQVPQCAQGLGQVVHDEAVARGEHVAADYVHLPARDVGVDAVDEGGVVVDGRQVLEEVGLVDHVAHVVAGVAHEGERRLGRDLLDPSAEALVGHVVLQDVHDVGLGALVLPRELVEGHAVPESHHANLAVRVVHEQLGGRHLAPGDEDAVRRELAEHVRLARALGTQLHQVVVALAVRYQARQLE